MSLLSKRPLLILAALAVLLGSGLAYMYITADPPGYCREQQRYIPDEEFIKASVAILEWDMNRIVTYQDGTKKKRKDYSYYQELDFDPKNPNCCSVGWAYTGDILERSLKRILGWQEVYLRLTPKAGGKRSSYADTLYHFKYSICGELLDSSIGHEGITTSNYLEITTNK